MFRREICKRRSFVVADVGLIGIEWYEIIIRHTRLWPMYRWFNRELLCTSFFPLLVLLKLFLFVCVVIEPLTFSNGKLDFPSVFYSILCVCAWVREIFKCWHWMNVFAVVMRSMCLMWCGSNEASEWFTIWTMSDERQETMVLYLRIWHFDSIPFFSSIEFIGIQWNQQNIQIYIHQLTHTHKNTLTLVVLLLDSNKFDKIFKFPWASAWHQIRISYQTARSFDSYSEKCKCSKAQCLLIHTHTHSLPIGDW